MKRFIFTIITIFCIANTLVAQEGVYDYRRSSLYSILINHPKYKYSNEIQKMFIQIPLPDKFNNHDLSIKCVITRDDEVPREFCDAFIENNDIAKRMVSKWFNRNKSTGECNMDLVAMRGQYDADVLDVEFANKTLKGTAMLSDAGEDLISNTFLIINDISYVDREAKHLLASGWLGLFRDIGLGAFAVYGAANGMSQQDLSNIQKQIEGRGAIETLLAELAGFRVDITTYLYKLEWNEETAVRFYEDYYINHGINDPEKVKSYKNEKSLFKLKYVGEFKSRSGKTVMKGVNNPDDVFKKVLTRSIDENIVKLQQSYEEFRVKAPIYSVENGYVTVPIGLKEGVTASSKYEILEARLNNEGKVLYHRVGTLKPEHKLIWDNRFMASEENAENSELSFTTFKIVDGNKIQPGMLIREIR